MSYFIVSSTYELPEEFRGDLTVDQKDLIVSKLGAVAFVNRENSLAQQAKIVDLNVVGIVRDVVDWKVTTKHALTTQADADAFVAIMDEVKTENSALRSYELTELSRTVTEMTEEEWMSYLSSGSQNLVFDVPPAFPVE